MEADTSNRATAILIAPHSGKVLHSRLLKTITRYHGMYCKKETIELTAVQRAHAILL